MDENKIAVVDLEASEYNIYGAEVSDKIDMVGFYDGDEYYVFSSVSSFLDFLKENPRFNRYKIFAHNGGKYDFLFILEGLKEKNMLHNITQIILRGSSIIRFVLRFNNSYAIEFRDSYKILPSSLRKLGEAFGIQKGHMELCQTYEELIEYNKQDCIVLYNVIKKFKDELKLKSIPLTAPSLALREFLRFNGIRNVSQISFVGKYDSFARQSYVGGRVEVFRREVNEPSAALDVNSLYPAVMRTNLYPVGKPEFLTEENEVKQAFHSGKLGIYEVDWYAPHLYTPVLWEKDEKEKKLYFRINRDRNYLGHGIYAYPEIKCAIDTGYVLTFKNALVYDEEDYIFEEFVDRYYEMKKQGGAKKEIAKIILNSCYGKFGQRRTIEQLFISTDPRKIKEAVEMTAYLKDNKFCNACKVIPVDFKLGIFVKSKEVNSKNFNVVLASMITSYARVFLFESMRRVEFSQYYCDTDSLFIPERYIKKLPLSADELGKWKIEYLFDKAVFFLPKTYIVNSEKGIICKAKGVPFQSIHKISKMKFEDAVEQIRIGEFKNYHITPFKQAIRMGLPFGRVRESEKVLNLNQTKRIFLEDGSSIPF